MYSARYSRSLFHLLAGIFCTWNRIWYQWTEFCCQQRFPNSQKQYFFLPLLSNNFSSVVQCCQRNGQNENMNPSRCRTECIEKMKHWSRISMVFFWPCIILETCFNYQLNAQFLYSITICMLQYNPRHVSSINMPIFRRKNCIITASGIATLCKRLYSMSDDNKMFPPEDGHVNARNMSGIVM